MLYELGDGQTVLEDVIPKRRAVEGYEVEREFPTIGRRIMVPTRDKYSTKTARPQHCC